MHIFEFLYSISSFYEIVGKAWFKSIKQLFAWYFFFIILKVE